MDKTSRHLTFAALVSGAALGFVLAHIQPAEAQFARGQLMKAEQLNSALASPSITGGTINGAPVGQLNPAAGTFTTLRATATATISPLNAAVIVSPSGSGFVTIGPSAAGTMDSVAVGGSTPLSGRFTVLRTSGTAPTCTSNCGTSPSVAGTDTSMTVTMGATGSPASGWVVTFATPWGVAPACTSTSAKSGMVAGKAPIVVVTTTTTATVTTNGTAPATADKYHVLCVGVS